jgi:L-iditol 2-dehydrogenase
MKAAVLIGPEHIEVQDVATPTIKSNEVLVKLKDCGICTLEQRLYRGDMEIYFPIIPGHEAAGEVIESGKDVRTNLPKGTSVALDLVRRCGECYYCRTERSNMCENRFRKGAKILGGFGEYVVVNRTQVYPLPDNVSFREATFVEPVACCVRSLKKIGLSLAEDLLILGAGPMGLMHLQVARAMGARVIVSDPDAKRCNKAKELGAAIAVDPGSGELAAAVNEATNGRGVEGCIVTSPSHSALKDAVENLSFDGRVNIYTSYNDGPSLPLDANTLHRNEYLITGSEGRVQNDFLTAVRLISFGYVNVKPLISSIISYNEIDKGIKDAMSNSTYRVLLEHEAP